MKYHIKNNIILSFFVLILSFSTPSLITAAENNQESPPFIEGTTKVDAEGVIELVQNLPSLVIVDARIKGDHTEGYIEGSVSIPDVDTNCDRLKSAIPKFDSPVLFYCNGVKCGRSVKSAKTALSCGYKNVYWFRGGFKEWRDKGYPYITHMN